MSLPDTIFILLAALVLFGPKKLPEIARQVGKLLAELRRASNEFKFQMEEELRQSDETERHAKAEAAAAVATAPAADSSTDGTPQASTLTIQPPATGAPVPNHVSPLAETLPAPVEEIPDPPHPHIEREATPHA
jgi:sec-independent protein translocase protein TatB